MSYIIIAWSKNLNLSLFRNCACWSLRSENMECIVVEDVWPIPYWLPWIILFLPWWIMLCILLNELLFTFRNVWVHLVWKVTVGVEPVFMVSGWVGSPPTLQRGIDTTYCLYCGIFGHISTHVCGIPVDIIWVSQSGKWRMFLILPVRRIYIMKIFSWEHEHHLYLLLWLFVSCFWRS